MITDATIQQARLYPELIPDAMFTNIPIESEATTTPLELTRIQGLFCRLCDVAIDQDADVDMRFTKDGDSITTGAALTDNEPLASSFDRNFDILAKRNLKYTMFNNNAGAAKNNHRTHFNLWVYPPTIADKIKFGMAMSVEEKAIAEELGVYNSVEKGILPLPIWEKIKREYEAQLSCIETHEPRPLAVGATATTIETVRPKVGEFIVLTDIMLSPGANAAANVRLRVTRDNDAQYVDDLKGWALTGSRGVRCFIPATDQLIINLISDVAAPNISCRYTIWRVRLTNIHRARWWLASPDEIPGDTYKKVMAGII